MFCPKCGAADQTPDSYCRQCGEWLPDLSSRRGLGRFGPSTREHKIRKMRALQLVSVGLSLTSTAIVITSLLKGRDNEILILAAICGFLVAVYQVITMVLGYKVLAPKADQNKRAVSPDVRTIGPGNTADLIKPDSVVEGTTRLLDHVPAQPGRPDDERT